MDQDTFYDIFLSFNIDNLLDIYDELKDKYYNLGFLNNGKSSDFIDIIINNTSFIEIEDDDEEYFSD